MFLQIVEEKVGKAKDQQTAQKRVIIKSPVLRFLKPFNAFLLAVNHQLTT